MDTDGARALAERIAKGNPEMPAPAKDDGGSEGEAQAGDVEIVYVKPGPKREPDVRIYVQGPDGGLERRR
jgi:hypothetical protein